VAHVGLRGRERLFRRWQQWGRVVVLINFLLLKLIGQRFQQLGFIEQQRLRQL